ncbi:glucose/galactose MFS transporter [Capnocytophaga catalasegens]|uniref:Glucose/galactose MFS transporter n=1 Tax=Capnocytophaga catalasegens TaxID=1004260 RepID=A0AAV5AXE3_9FLAO|nr:glucose/galactose MFS transporter [Capnocytophaga catalasegens]GIZ16069.1 glucose/galactose MFS transporter [Capnocytophaga catalasegens]GJM50228.1 glucose/galactose MFS transporter [Capnocytophaga catalasegens]GJM53459.1 glucose/galactose MFS transporter [Capnocytophaga catalasegens]
MTSQKQNFVIPLAFIGLMFFSIGFALGINSYLIPVLKNTLNISSTKSYLLVAATFTPFLIFGYPASILIKKIGYKRTMAFSFLLFAIAFALFIPSANTESLLLFLLASFVSGAGNAFLQASVNPYTTILGPIESAARRISIMGICNKLAWPIAPLFLAVVIGKETTQVQTSDLTLPFYIIVGVFLLLGLISLIAPLPEVKAQGEDETNNDTQLVIDSNKKSIFDFPHLLLGTFALFLYVGVETISLTTMVDYSETLGIDNQPISFLGFEMNIGKLASFIPSIGMIIGYICGAIFIPKYISQSTALKICSLLAIFGTIAVATASSEYSIYFISFMALGCSLMWPAIWPLAMDGLGKLTKTGASLLTMAIAGGAILPLVFAALKDNFGMQNAYWLCLPCFAFILYYGMAGHKVGRK